MYRAQRNYENAQRMLFEGAGQYDIPEIEPTQFDNADFIGFNYAKSAKNCKDKAVHFFLDDYQFARVWTDPDRYIPMLQRFKYVLTPDFSLYTDFPKPLQIYNHYRKHWLGAYWQMHGIHVIPTICWSDTSSFDWCFDGEPTNSIVSISSVGTQQTANKKEAFAVGCREAIKRLNPSQILWHGKCPEEFDWNVIHMKTFSDRLKGRCAK